MYSTQYEKFQTEIMKMREFMPSAPWRKWRSIHKGIANLIIRDHTVNDSSHGKNIPYFQIKKKSK